MKSPGWAAGFAALLVILSGPLQAQECWAISNIKGYSAYASDSYEFTQDGLPATLLVCFTANGGTVTGTDIKFVKFGSSTLAGFGGNEEGNELFGVYQIDRASNKLLYVKSRIGTKTVAPIFSDVVAVIPQALVSRIRAHPLVDYLEPVGRVQFEAQDTTWNVRRVRAPEAWTSSSGSAVKLLVIDTGTPNDHSDLSPAVVQACDGSNGLDGNGHGTHVAGIASAATSSSLRTLLPPKPKGMASSRFTSRRGPPPSAWRKLVTS
ncbi:MAG: S8 family serine peptidase, partial [Acidobacteriota bacterium]